LQAHGVLATDCFAVDTVALRQHFVIELSTREAHILGATVHPKNDFVTQVARSLVGGRVANSLPGMAAHVTDDMQLEPLGRFATENTLPLPQRPTCSPVSGKARPKTRSRLAHRDIEAPRYVSNSGIGGRNRHAGVLRQRTFALATGIE